MRDTENHNLEQDFTILEHASTYNLQLIGGFYFYILLIITFFSAFFILVRHITFKQQVKNIIKQLEKVAAKETRETVKVSLVDSDIEVLANCLNTIIKEQKRLFIETKRHEAKLKQQIADISHGLRTPLTSINGYIQLLEKNNLTATHRSEYLSIIRHKSANLSALIQNFFELSVIDSEEYTLDIDKIDITSVISNVLLSNYALLKEKGIEPQVDLPHSAVYIMSNNMACQRIVQNLISNAIRYTCGTIYLELKENAKGSAEFSISNETKNLSEEAITHLFARFYTGDKSRANGNTGLGLYIVKILVEKTGGNIYASLDRGILKMKFEY